MQTSSFSSVRPGLTRRALGAGALAAFGAATLGRHPVALAADFPSKPITVILPFPAGGMLDAVVRAMLDAASQEIGQPFVLTHRAGAGGVTGTASLTTMGDADGYTLAVMHNTVIRQPHMIKVPWDPRTDFSYVIGMAGLATGIAVAADAPWKSLADLLADARKRPGEISWGNVGSTSINRIYAERLARAAGVKFNFIPFKGGNEQLTALIGRHLDVYGDPGFGAMATGGKVRVLATFTEERLKRWPAVPTVKEQGYDLVIQSPFGLVASKNLDPKISARLQTALRKGMEDPTYQRLLSDFDLAAWPMDGTAFRAYAQAQYTREKQMLDEVGFKPE
jgi:tripartite-type tricarboxylate transporter receptor subunit TctC